MDSWPVSRRKKRDHAEVFVACFHFLLLFIQDMWKFPLWKFSTPAFFQLKEQLFLKKILEAKVWTSAMTMNIFFKDSVDYLMTPNSNRKWTDLTPIWSKLTSRCLDWPCESPRSLLLTSIWLNLTIKVSGWSLGPTWLQLDPHMMFKLCLHDPRTHW